MWIHLMTTEIAMLRKFNTINESIILLVSGGGYNSEENRWNLGLGVSFSLKRDQGVYQPFELKGEKSISVWELGVKGKMENTKLKINTQLFCNLQVQIQMSKKENRLFPTQTEGSHLNRLQQACVIYSQRVREHIQILK